MTPKEFIILRIKNTLQEYPKFKASYEIDTIDGSNYVEIFPSELYKSSLSLQEKVAKITFEFNELFQHNSLCFFSDSDILEVENPVFEMKGKNYDLYRYNFAEGLFPTNYEGEIPKTILNQNFVAANIVNLNNIEDISTKKFYNENTENSTYTYNYQFAMAA